MTRGRRFGALRLLSGQALKSCPPQSARAGSARAYIDKGHERDARAYINNRPRARAPAPHATWAGRGVSRTPSLKSREDRHPPLTAESNSSAENLGHSPEGWQNSETYAALAGE